MKEVINKNEVSVVDINLVNRGNIIWASSKEVAERFNKRHDNILQSINSLKKDLLNFQEMFLDTEIPDSYGRLQKAYLMNRDGFSLLVMGFTGKAALEWKLKYIEAFNKMEKTITTALSSKDAAILSIVYAENDIARAIAISEYEKVITLPLKESIQCLEMHNDKLTNDNRALSESILEWENRSKLNAGIRKLSSTIHVGFGDLYNMLFRELKYGHHIDLRARKKKETESIISTVRKKEWPIVIQVFSAICNANNVSVSDMIQCRCDLVNK